MRFADRFGLAMGPLLLRVLLAATFMWAGLGKVFTDINVGPDDAARLAQMKITVNVISPTTAPETLTTPALVLPDPADDTPTTLDTPPAKPAAPAAETPATTTTPTAKPAGGSNTQNKVSPLDEVAFRSVAWSGYQAATTATPVDFPEGGRVRKLYAISLMIDSAANPGLDDEANPIQPIWPAALAKGTLPRNLAWVATLSEIGLGLTLLFGLVTRLSALGIACVMGTAAWLDQIGPAIQQGDPRLGFLPNYDVFDVMAWQPFAWQMSLFFAALALVCMGSGTLGLDRALFRRRESVRFEAPPTQAEARQTDETPDYDPKVNPFTKKMQDDDES